MSDTTPKQPLTRLCCDEDILVHAGSDFGLLSIPWQEMASGNDGAFLAGSPWVLTSATVDFGANGVAPNSVVHLTSPIAVYSKSGHYLAVDDVSGKSITLRRPYKAPGIGQPPAPSSGQPAVGFEITTFDPQIAEATYELYQRFGLDENTAAVGIQRSPGWVYDLQVLRTACVYTVLYERYVQANRTNKGDFDLKVDRFRQKMDDAIGRATIRFGPQGASSESTGIFSTRLSR